MNNKENKTPSENFVTVVSVGNKNEENEEANSAKEKEYVTVLRIGENDTESNFITEEVLVYRLPGERLGFGLKFEGGTKATEYVKKLFIQSCAPDSPASKVLGSWGHLTEGDEVLVIDSRPVTSMTRMDCVKCLKDSSVVIKLLVRHQKEDSKNKTEEGLPLVISAEKKKPPALPPTPPPVPPRKVPRKHLRTKYSDTGRDVLDSTLRLKTTDTNMNKYNIVKSNSPETRFNRKLNDASNGPPDAEYYVDLFSQESIHSLSESDDTASTISTVVDRNGNSLPSTPKSIQKHLDISNFPDDDELFNLNSNEPKLDDKFEFISTDFLETTDLGKNNQEVTITDIENLAKKPDAEFPDMKNSLIFQTHDENMNIFSLPRLVDFVPKSFNEMDNKRIMNLFLSCERGEHLDFKFTTPEDASKRGSFNDDLDMFPKWTISPQLATIGEVEEECLSNENISNRFSTPTPTLVVHCEEESEDQQETSQAMHEIGNQNMEPPPSDRRQPPDGHEFPDFEESFQNRTNDSLLERYKPPTAQNQEANTQPSRKNSFEQSETFTLNKMTSKSNMDLSTREKDQGDITEDKENRTENLSNFSFYTRSQSLCDISARITQNDPLQNLVEQRRKNLSKLKGLVIPDSISEGDFSSTINLPEIKSSAVSIEEFKNLNSSEVSSDTSKTSNVNTALPPISPAWAATVNFPKYSPAFKRKDLKIYSTNKRDFDTVDSKKVETKPSRDHYLNSITKRSVDNSPAMSENNLDISRDAKSKPRRPFGSFSIETNLLANFHKREINTDEESDNDSAVSSSQSSFASRPTTSPSPTTSVENYGSTLQTLHSDYSSEFRHVKSASVEALNRKNILASAKCRSGKDFKIGSPVVNRKLEVSDDKTETANIKIEKKEEIKVVDDEKVMKAAPKILDVPKLESPLPAEKVPSFSPKPTAVPLRTNLKNLELKSTPRTSLPSSREKTSIFLNNLKPVPPATKREERISKFSSVKSLSVTDLRKNFEEIAKTTSPIVPKFPSRKSDIFPTKQVPVSPNMKSEKTNLKQMSSVTNKSPCESKGVRKKSVKVILKPNNVGENIGIAITGGSEENKDIVVHRIRYGTVAYQDGTLTKGDHILSINGVDTAGLSYTEAVQLLKVPAETFIIEIALKDEVPKDEKILKRRSISLDSTLDTGRTNAVVTSKKPNHEIVLVKDQNGLGFSVEGGRDSPLGDVPIIVKKIFQGGVADKDGRIKVGDEIISVNEIDFTNLSRIQAWTIMKKVDVGKTKIMIYR